MERWKDKVALVTGASSGIGRAIAEQLLGAGMRVAASARREDRIADIADSDALFPIRADLRDESDIARMFGAVRDRWGGVDVLVNNAGLGHAAPLVSGETAHWREMLEVNVLALCVCTREAIQDMRARGDAGHVIHIASMASHRVPPGSGVYSASKFAVRALTEALRAELRGLESNIRVTEISPGYVETEFAALYHKSDESARRTYGAYKCLESTDVANAVVYALSQPPHVQVHDILMRPTHQRS